MTPWRLRESLSLLLVYRSVSFSPDNVESTQETAEHELFEWTLIKRLWVIKCSAPRWAYDNFSRNVFVQWSRGVNSFFRELILHDLLIRFNIIKEKFCWWTLSTRFLYDTINWRPKSSSLNVHLISGIFHIAIVKPRRLQHLKCCSFLPYAMFYIDFWSQYSVYN